MIRIEKTAYRGWKDCLRISNGATEAIVSAGFGPRVLHFSFLRGRNVFGCVKNAGRGRWKLYGGHRFWHAPEDKVLSYEPDNAPVRVQQIKGGLRLIQPVEKKTHLQKILELRMAPGASRMRVTHRLKNCGRRSIERAAWALSVMERGGTAVIPLPGKFHPDRLLPNRRLALWPYTDPGDSRISWKKDRILIRQAKGKPLKLGALNTDGWIDYLLTGVRFRKKFEPAGGECYPDFGSNCEVYTNAKMLELETLSPLTVLRPGAELAHSETWELL